MSTRISIVYNILYECSECLCCHSPYVISRPAGSNLQEHCSQPASHEYDGFPSNLRSKAVYQNLPGCIHSAICYQGMESAGLSVEQRVTYLLKRCDALAAGMNCKEQQTNVHLHSDDNSFIARKVCQVCKS